ncbi:MAG: hypothetical protein QXL15_02945 [Candidatus Korarchaeota archaeon]
MKILVVPMLFVINLCFSAPLLCSVPLIMLMLDFNFAPFLLFLFLLWALSFAVIISFCAVRGGWYGLIPVFPATLIALLFTLLISSFLVILEFMLIVLNCYISTGMPPFLNFHVRLKKIIKWAQSEELSGEYVLLPSMFGWDDESLIDSRVFNTLVAKFADSTGKFWDLIIVKGFPRLKIYF